MALLKYFVSHAVIHGFGLSCRGVAEVSNLDGFSRAYIVKISPSAEFFEGGLTKILGGFDTPLSPP
jgi:hypothetical protein